LPEIIRDFPPDFIIFYYTTSLEQIVNLESIVSVLKILLLAGNFALVNPDERHQYRNKGNKPFQLICGVSEEFE